MMLPRLSAVLLSVAASLVACQSTAAPSLMPSTGEWPNEPDGFFAMTNQPWNDLADHGWNRRDSTDDRIVADTAAPSSPGAALEYVYPAGFPGGTAPATHYFPLDGRKELFIGLQWKVSSPWQGHSSAVNKMQFLYAKGTDIAMVMYGPPAGPFEIRVMPQWREHGGGWLRPNVTLRTVTLGKWHSVEWYLKYESTYGAGDGIVRWWVNSELAGNYTNVHFPDDQGFVEYQISPTWGGVGDSKARSEYFRFDHSYISVPAAKGE
jgi:hypothetical protein